MTSLFDELSAKIAKDQRITAKAGARQDLGILLFSRRDAFNALWKAADRCLTDRSGAIEDLSAAVEELRPLFGQRG